MSQDDFKPRQIRVTARVRIMGQLKQLLDDFEEIGAIDSATMRTWENEGAFG